MAAVTELGYVCFGVSDLAEWRDFATNLLGLEVFEEPGEPDRLYLRTDYWHHRIILEKNPVELPPSLVAQQEQAMLQEYVRMIRMTGQPPNLGEDFMSETKDNAARRVRAALLLGAIAQERGIRVEAADLDKRLEEMAQRSGKHVAKLRAELQGERRETLESQILEAKLLEYLLSQATINESAT